MLRHNLIFLLVIVFQVALIVKCAEKRFEEDNAPDDNSPAEENKNTASTEDDDDDDDSGESDDKKSTSPATTMTAAVLARMDSSTTTFISMSETKENNLSPSASAIVTHDNQTCVAVTLEGQFTFDFAGQERQVPVIPDERNTSGQCLPPVLHIKWKHSSLTLKFGKIKDDSEWKLTQMKLEYSVKSGDETKSIALHMHDDDLESFTAPLGQSFVCSEPADFALFDHEGKKHGSVVINSIQMQAYNVSSEWGTEKSCPTPTQMAIKEEAPKRKYQSDVAPIAVGSTLAILTLCVLAGYAIYRSLTTKKVDYSTME